MCNNVKILFSCCRPFQVYELRAMILAFRTKCMQRDIRQRQIEIRQRQIEMDRTRAKCKYGHNKKGLVKCYNKNAGTGWCKKHMEIRAHKIAVKNGTWRPI